VDLSAKGDDLERLSVLVDFDGGINVSTKGRSKIQEHAD
jgi:hypothetical protein